MARDETPWPAIIRYFAEQADAAKKSLTSKGGCVGSLGCGHGGWFCHKDVKRLSWVSVSQELFKLTS
jgi:hypothetical protein